MALNFRSFHLMILVLLLASLYLDFSSAAPAPSAAPGGGGPKTGGYEPIKDITEPQIQGIGKFAVDEYNKNAKRELIFEKVVKGEWQVVSGVNFKLVIVGKDGGDGASKQYEAIVWEKPWNFFKKLLSFTELH